MATGPLALIVGTRPEGIKMMPVYLSLKKANFPVTLISTGQHRELLSEVFTVFGVQPDIDLALGKPQQSLSYLTQQILIACEQAYTTIRPSMVLVQGDTTTVMAAAMQAFYQQIPVGHVEAGLRTGDMHQPFPEEFNRRMISMIARYHFAPTAQAVENLIAEGIDRNTIFHTGNTVVDALHYMKTRIADGSLTPRVDLQHCIDKQRSLQRTIVLLTAHRRESFDGGITRIFQTIKKLSHRYPHLFFIYPQHPNPQVQHAIQEADLALMDNLMMMSPLNYADLVYALTNTDLVMTDSGGIQEEAVSLGKQTIILRDKTERVEGVLEGIAQLAGTDPEKIMQCVERALMQAVHPATTIYGDGHAAEKIIAIVQNVLKVPVPAEKASSYGASFAKIAPQSMPSELASFAGANDPKRELEL